MTSAPLHVLAVGAFGREVAQELRAIEGGAVAVDTADAEEDLRDSSRWASSPHRVLAAWRPVPRLAERVDATAHAWGTTWCMVVLEQPDLIIGPVIRPGRPPCGACRTARRRQHASRPDLDEAMVSHLERNPAAGPLGFLPHHASFGAACALRLLRHGAVGTQHVLHLLDGTLMSSRVVGVHGCPRCGLGRSGAHRSAGLLLEDLHSGARAPSGGDASA